MSFASVTRESRRCTLITLETHISTSLLIFHLVLILVLRLVRTPSRDVSRFFHVPNHRSYGLGSRENNFVLRHFGYSPHPHCGDRFPRRHDFPAGGSYTHFEPRHLDGPYFSVVVHVPLVQMVKCKRL
jgi:hypothetical protein